MRHDRRACRGSEGGRDHKGRALISHGITKEQIKAVGLDSDEEHQFDGWLQRYGLQEFKKDIKEMVGL